MPKPNAAALSIRIDERLAELGMSAREASLKAGLHVDAIRNIRRAGREGKPYSPQTDTLQALARTLETTTAWLTQEEVADLPPVLSPQAKPLPRREDPDRPIPVFASAEGGDGSMVLDSDPVEYAARPHLLGDEGDLYGVVIEGTSMAKTYRPGDTAWVHPRYRERRDEPCIFRRYNNQTGEVSMTIKWLLDFNATVWKVEQFNPPRQFELKRVDWPECYRVLGMKNRS